MHRTNVGERVADGIPDRRQHGVGKRPESIVDPQAFAPRLDQA